MRTPASPPNTSTNRTHFSLFFSLSLAFRCCRATSSLPNGIEQFIAGFYNQYIQQQMSSANGNPDKSEENSEQKANSDTGSDAIESNKLMLQINADNRAGTPTSANNEILQQLYNYSQMSGELIK